MQETEFEHIANALRPLLLTVCKRFVSATGGAMEADDLVQEALLRLWKMRDRLDGTNHEALGVRIAKNLCIDHYRTSHIQAVSLTSEEAMVSESADQGLLATDTKRWIDNAMRQLPSTQRTMLRMRSEGMSLDDIAAACGATKTSTKTMISAARRTLLKYIKGGI